MSWWPKHATWTKAGLYWGHWTYASENWFHNRLKEIRAGKAGLKPANEWRRNLNFRSETRKLVQLNEVDAKGWLAHHVDLLS
jgi:hypothetical protein